MRVSSRRSGAIGPLTVILLVPMVGMLAFAIDLGYIWWTDAELQNASDSAALAGASRLVDGHFQLQAYGSTMNSNEKQALLTNSILNAKAEAKKYGEQHIGGCANLKLLDADIEVGYIEDINASADSSAGSFQTPSVTKFPNSVRVKVRRDEEVDTGSLSLWFGRIFGIAAVRRQADATATIMTEGVAGFSGPDSGLLPLVMKRNVYEWLLGYNNKPPTEVREQDKFTVIPPLEGEFANPYKILDGADGKREARVYGYKQKGNLDEDDTSLPSGNWGLMDLTAGVNGAPGNDQISNWIRNGPTEQDLATWGNRGLYALPDDPLSVNVQTGFQNTIQDDFNAIIGEPRVMPVYEDVTDGSGQNAGYRIIGFVGVTIVEAKLGGNSGRSYISVQLTHMMSPSPILAPPGTPGSASFVYRGMALSR